MSINKKASLSMLADQRDLTQAILTMRQEQQQTDMGNESIRQESPTSGQEIELSRSSISKTEPNSSPRWSPYSLPRRAEPQAPGVAGPPGYKFPMLRPYLLKLKVLDLDDTVEISWDLQADIHSPEMVSKVLAEVEGNGILSFLPLTSNLLPREVRALDEALSKAGPESSLVSLTKMVWDIRLGEIKIQDVPGLRSIVRTWGFQEISPQNCSRIPIPAHTAAKVSEQRTFQPY